MNRSSQRAPGRRHSKADGDVTASLVQRNPRDETALETKVGDVLARRFRLERELGRGGSGVVFRAEDLQQSGTWVALKVLRHLGPNAIYRLKSEFRSLAEVSHVNLVALYELFFEEGRWFFTMELVEGATTFYDHVVEDDVPEGQCQVDLERLRRVLRQLAHAVGAIHAVDMLHRDLKPSNVLVTPEGRVVVVDFGLVRRRETREMGITDTGFVGTPYYAAPEQADPKRASPALDWYAVGVMLYEALTGVGPYHGNERLTPPSSRVRGIPPELDALCMRLLAPQPMDRADGRDILRTLPARRSSRPPSPLSAASLPAGESFVGRERELAALDEALAAVGRGEPAVVLLAGTSGTGKTRCAEHFLETRRAAGQLEVFASRCYAHEQLPFKAFDHAIDQLSSYLGRLPIVECAALLPRDTHALTQVFPVLKRLHAVDLIRPRVEQNPSAQRQRERAFGALKQLLGGVADRAPAALFIDDLQWADIDSIRLLTELLSGPDVPPVLVVATYRSDERTESDALRELFQSGATKHAREIELGALGEPESRLLAQRLARAEGIESAELVERVVAESGGHPLFLGELAHYLSSRPTTARVSLGEALEARAAGLAPLSRELLELICVAGRPVSRGVMNACFEGVPTNASWTELRASRLVRVRTDQDDVRVEPYHDRVREEVVGRLSSERCSALHARLASGYAHSENPDSLGVVEHLVAAGKPSEAIPFATQSAQRMAEALAFGSAIDLLQLALAHSEAPEARRALRLRLIELYVADLQAKAAADLCLETAAELPAQAARNLERRALELYLSASHQREAYALLGRLSRDAGLARPRSSLMSVLRSVPSALWLWIRGGPSWRTFERARQQKPSPRDVWRGWLAWSAYVGVTTDLTLSAYYAVQMLRLAARTGDAELFALARGWWHAFNRILRRRVDPADEARVERLAENASPHVRGWLWLQRAIAVGYDGHYDLMLEELDRLGSDSWSLFEGASSPGFVEVSGRAAAAYWGGQMVSFRRLMSTMKQSARKADDRNFLHRFEEWSIAEGLTRGDLEAMGAAYDHALQSGRTFDPPRRLDPWWGAMRWLAAGEPAHAAEEFRGELRHFRWKGDSRLAMNALVLNLYRGLVEASAWAQTGKRRYLRGLRASVRALRRIDHLWQPPVLAQMEGLLALALGHREQAIQLLERAARGYTEIAHFAQAEAVRWRLGALRGDEAGEKARAAATAQLEEQGILDVGLWVRVYAPDAVHRAAHGSLAG